MGTIKETINLHYNKKKEKERELGKYWATDFWKIHKGYLTTGNFFKSGEIDKKGQKNISMGEAMESWLCKILREENVEFEDQHRLEIKLGDIQLSGKTDFYFPDKIIETKCPDIAVGGIPEKWAMQMEFYFRASNLPVFLGVFYKSGDEIIRFFKYEPDDKLWETMQNEVIDFDSRLSKKTRSTIINNVKTKTK